MLLNKLCESFNSVILSARSKPIVGMLETIRILLMESVHKKRDAMRKYKGSICPKICKKLEKLKLDAAGWIPRWSGSDQFEVVGPYGEQYKVEVGKHACGCRKWDLSGIPCVHAIAAINFLNKDPLNFVHDYYKCETYIKTYEHLLSPINGKDLWPVVDSSHLQPPNVKIKVGRKKMARRREPEEIAPNATALGRKGIKMTCKNCGLVGHNKRGCKKPKLAGGDGSDVGAASGETGVGTASGVTDVGGPTGVADVGAASGLKGSVISSSVRFIFQVFICYWLYLKIECL